VRGDFSPSAKGELLTFLKRVLFCQPLRSSVIGFLTDGFNVVLMGLKRKDNQLFETPQLPLTSDGAGRFAVITLLSCKSSDLGFRSVDTPPGYIADYHLGGGLTSEVYAGRKDGEKESSVVIKVCRNVDAAEHESNILNKFVGQSGFPQVQLRHQNILVMTPLAKTFSLDGVRPRAVHMNELRQTLLIAHNKGVLHCDVRPSNWLVDSNGASLLIDWGFAIQVGANAQAYQGTVSFASKRVLTAIQDSGGMVKMEPADDWASFVRLGHYYLTGLRPMYDDVDGSTNLHKVQLHKVQTSLDFLKRQSSSSSFVSNVTTSDQNQLQQFAELFGVE
jgi:hypothetical protein